MYIHLIIKVGVIFLAPYSVIAYISVITVMEFHSKGDELQYPYGNFVRLIDRVEFYKLKFLKND